MMRLISIRPKEPNGKPLKAFCDVEFDNGIVIKEFRVVQEEGKRPWVALPQLSYKDPATGQIKHRVIVYCPSELKGQIDLLILNEWSRVKEKLNGNIGIK